MYNNGNPGSGNLNSVMNAHQRGGGYVMWRKQQEQHQQRLRAKVAPPSRHSGIESLTPTIDSLRRTHSTATGASGQLSLPVYRTPEVKKQGIVAKVGIVVRRLLWSGVLIVCLLATAVYGVGWLSAPGANGAALVVSLIALAIGLKARSRLKKLARPQTASNPLPRQDCSYCGGQGWIATDNPSYRPFAGLAGTVGTIPCPACGDDR